MLRRIFFCKTVKTIPNALCSGTSLVKWYIVSVNAEKMYPHIKRKNPRVFFLKEEKKNVM